MILKSLLICIVICFPGTLSERKVVSLVELSKCKQSSSYGYGYKNFFVIEDIQHMRNESDLVHTRVAILAGKDAHILLSETNIPSLTDNVIEIVLGAGTNTFCEIRRRMGFFTMKSKRVVDILSYVDPVAFVIRVTNTGLIDVRYEGDAEPLIYAQYSNFNMTVNFISFCCWGTATCKFFYDCPNSLYDTLTQTKGTMSPTEYLENDLFTGYTKEVAPYQLEKVDLGLNILNVQFDHMRNIMTTRGQFFYKWQDSKMVWDPEHYENIRELPMLDHTIWFPILRFGNGVGLKNADTASFLSRSVILQNGTIRAKSKPFEVSTWCAVGPAKVWPHEHVQCHINLTLANAIDARLDRLADHKAEVEQSENSHWSILSVDLTLFKRTDGSQMAYTIVLKRNEAFIDSLFGTPLNVALVLLMASIFVQESMYRLLLVLLPTIMLFLSLIMLSKSIPPFYTPLIVHYYFITLMFTVLGLVCHVIAQNVRKSPATKSSPPTWIRVIHNNRFLSYFYCFVPNTSDYDNMSKEINSWMVISSTIDRVYFLSIAVFHIIIAAKGY